MIQIRAVGDTASLLELESNTAVHSAATAARRRWGDELADVVPGHTTVLLVWSGAIPSSDVLMSEFDDRRVRGLDPAGGPGAAERDPGGGSPESVTIAVRYDGADLRNVAGQLRVSVEEIVALHTTAQFTVAFMGFAPGFPYLIEGPGSAVATGLLALPRLATPRTMVPAGSVAVAAGYCGVYPRSSPGGWNLLGHTEVELFDPEAQSTGAAGARHSRPIRGGVNR